MASLGPMPHGAGGAQAAGRGLAGSAGASFRLFHLGKRAWIQLQEQAKNGKSVGSLWMIGHARRCRSGSSICVTGREVACHDHPRRRWCWRSCWGPTAGTVAEARLAVVHDPVWQPVAGSAVGGNKATAKEGSGDPVGDDFSEGPKR